MKNSNLRQNIITQVEKYINSLLTNKHIFYQKNLLDRNDILQIAREAALNYLVWARKKRVTIIPKVAINKARFAIFKICKKQSCMFTVPSYKSHQQKIKATINKINNSRTTMHDAEIISGVVGRFTDVDSQDSLEYLNKIIMNRLTERERDILYKRVLIKKSLGEIGKSWDISNERVRQIYRGITRKLRDILVKKELELETVYR